MQYCIAVKFRDPSKNYVCTYGYDDINQAYLALDRRNSEVMSGDDFHFEVEEFVGYSYSINQDLNFTDFYVEKLDNMFERLW